MKTFYEINICLLYFLFKKIKIRCDLKLKLSLCALICWKTDDCNFSIKALSLKWPNVFLYLLLKATLAVKVKTEENYSNLYICNVIIVPIDFDLGVKTIINIAWIKTKYRLALHKKGRMKFLFNYFFTIIVQRLILGYIKWTSLSTYLHDKIDNLHF